MLNTLDDIRTEFLVRLHGNTAYSWFTDTILNDWTNQAHRFAASYKKWAFTEGRVETTYAADSNDRGTVYPEGWKTDSIRILQVGGKRFQKINFYDYLAYREDYTSGADKVYSDHGRLYFINPNADASGTTTLWGQFLPAQLDTTNANATTVFSGAEEEGNYAIIELMESYFSTRNDDPEQSEFHFKRAENILNTLWQKIQDEQFAYQTKDRGLWKRFDVLEGTKQDELLRRDQFY